MKVVGLVSGGKDSVFNLHYCVHLGHEVVCLANLHPAEVGKEIDSFMYQTVGVEIVPMIAKAMELPLYCRAIAGTAKQPDTNAYEPVEGDETEDLFLLLQDVLRQHPDVTAVSTGAIFSDYQRLRVESVCQRLGLKSLAFLWRQEQPHLLLQMLHSGLDAVLVKTASMGLNEKHLGKSLRELEPHFHKLEKQFGFHVCGEGGEYETVALDGPLYKKRVELPPTTAVKHGGDAFYLRLTEDASLISKDGHVVPTQLPTLDFLTSLEHYVSTYPIIHKCPLHENFLSRKYPDILDAEKSREVLPTASKREGGVYPLTHGTVATSSLDRVVLGVESMEATDFFAALVSFLAAHNWSLRDAFYVELLVSDLSNFAVINAAYIQCFPASNPPARYCVEAALPSDVPLRIRVLLGKPTTSPRYVTHVQSISTWGMACIGPYSQCVKLANGTFYTAGVVGFVPHSMALVEPSSLSILSHESDDDASYVLTPWCAQLWMTMRTLSRVCDINKKDAHAASVVNVFVASNQTPSIQHSTTVVDVVRKYCPNALIIAQCVPRLPTLTPAIEVALLFPVVENGATDIESAPLCGAVREEQRNGVRVAWFDRMPSALPALKNKAISACYIPKGPTEDTIRAVLPGAALCPCVELDDPTATIRLMWFL